MKTGTAFNLFMLTFAIAGLILVAGNGFAQQKPAGEEKEKKTITIRVTTEADGKVVKIDTTFVAEGEFDEEAFLKQHGIEMKEQEMKMVQHEKQMQEHEMQMKQNQKEFQKQVMITSDKNFVSEGLSGKPIQKFDYLFLCSVFGDITGVNQNCSSG